MSDIRGRGDASPPLPPRLHALYAECARFVCRVLRYLGTPEADLDDRLEEVFLEVNRTPSLHERAPRLRARLYPMCARAARRYAGSLDTEVTPNSDLGWQLLNRLPRVERIPFALYELEDLPLIEVAEALRCAPRTIRAHLLNARAKVIAEVERRAASQSDAVPPVPIVWRRAR